MKNSGAKRWKVWRYVLGFFYVFSVSAMTVLFFLGVDRRLPRECFRKREREAQLFWRSRTDNQAATDESRSASDVPCMREQPK